MAQGFVIVAELKVKPGRLDEFLKAATRHATNSLTNEPGCLQFDVVHDSAVPDRVLMYEVYRDEAAYTAHTQSAHLAQMRPILGGLTAERTIHKLARIAHPTKASGGRRVLVAYPPVWDRPYLLATLETAGFTLIGNPHGRRLEEAELAQLLPGCTAVIAGSEPYTERVLTAAPGLAVIARFGVGYDSVDIAAATRHDVAVAMAFGTNHEAVADHTLALIAGVTHRLAQYHAETTAGGWRPLFQGTMHGITVGIVGFGRIGRAVAKRCHGFDMEILVADPAMDADTVARLGCRLVEVDELVAAADAVSINCPRSPSTLGLIDARRLALMKPGAIIVSTARGGIIDETALHAALVEGRIAGAGLDVFAAEPPTGSPLLELPNVLATPHIAGLSEQALEAMARRCVESILAITRGEDPGAGLVLNPEVLLRQRAAAAV